jgi:hypothetical protein
MSSGAGSLENETAFCDRNMQFSFFDIDHRAMQTYFWVLMALQITLSMHPDPAVESGPSKKRWKLER